MTKTVRKAEFNELKKDMILKNEDILYIVQNTVQVAQREGNIEVSLNEMGTMTVKVYDEFDFSVFHEWTEVVGELTPNGPVYYAKADDPSIEPDPQKHDSFIQAVFIKGDQLKVGQNVEGRTVAHIKKVLGTDEHIFIFLNKNGAVLLEFHVGKESDFSIIYGYREMKTID